MDTSSDNQLAKLAASGNSQAFEALYNKYVAPIYRFCYWQTNQQTEAEDLTQNVFIEMAKSISTFKGKGSFKNWLYTIAKRQINNWIRKKYQLPTSPLFDSIIESSDWIDPENEKLKESMVTQLLNTLPIKEREVLRHRFLLNYSVKETAAALQLTPSNVKVITYRALKLLKTKKIKL